MDLIVNTGSWGSIDVEWDDPEIRLFYPHLARFSRVIQFDRRGSGASDPVPLDALPPWESFVEELECVMNEVGSERAALIGAGDGGPVSMLYAANRPQRVSSLIILNSYARLLADHDYPIGVPADGPRNTSTNTATAGERSSPLPSGRQARLAMPHSWLGWPRASGPSTAPVPPRPTQGKVSQWMQGPSCQLSEFPRSWFTSTVQFFLSSLAAISRTTSLKQRSLIYLGQILPRTGNTLTFSYPLSKNS